MSGMTHDYTQLRWGHNIEFIHISEDGRHARVVGFGHGVCQDDFLVLANGPGCTTRYRITQFEHRRPSDCWRAHIEFAPRGERS